MPRIDRLQRLYQRRGPIEESVQLSAKSAAVLDRNKDHQYLVEAMQPIEAAYTDKTFAEAERVKSQLSSGLPTHYSASFDYQGSVTSDTHIRYYSDIDLLVMHGGFISLDPGTPPLSPYQGNVIQALQSLRSSTSTVLTQKFPAAKVDNKPGKSIALSGGSLARKIDVVVGNWWDTDLYKAYNVKMARGINILDSKVPEEVRNKPFLHNYNINDKDVKTGGLRKVIRLLKTLKYDAEKDVKISSYDVASLAYNMSNEALTVEPNAYLLLATKARSELKRFIDNQATREALLVPNGTRKVFGTEGASLEGLKALHAELSELVDSIHRAAATRLYNLSESTGEFTKRAWNEVLPSSVKTYMY